MLGDNIKKLGFGLMRLPRVEGKDDVIDIEQVKQMVDEFLAAGFTYFDTAWAYSGSEEAIREALVERYPRDKFQLATKNAAWINCKTREDALEQYTALPSRGQEQDTLTSTYYTISGTPAQNSLRTSDSGITS